MQRVPTVSGTANLLGLVGLVAAMELILEIGVENISQQLLRKRALLETTIQAKGYTILQTNSAPENASGIISMFRPGSDLTPLHQKLLDAGIITSLRADRTAQKYIRLSPHFYNTDAEFERLLDLL